MHDPHLLLMLQVSKVGRISVVSLLPRLVQQSRLLKSDMVLQPWPMLLWTSLQAANYVVQVLRIEQYKHISSTAWRNHCFTSGLWNLGIQLPSSCPMMYSLQKQQLLDKQTTKWLHPMIYRVILCSLYTMTISKCLGATTLILLDTQVLARAFQTHQAFQPQFSEQVDLFGHAINVGHVKTKLHPRGQFRKARTG